VSPEGRAIAMRDILVFAKWGISGHRLDMRHVSQSNISATSPPFSLAQQLLTSPAAVAIIKITISQ
jgi:hypothetical protein